MITLVSVSRLRWQTSTPYLYLVGELYQTLTCCGGSPSDASGQTRPASTTTEAESYLRVALNSGLIPPEALPFLRATTEDHALDSFQNLLFSIARFHEYTGNYPSKITVVGYEMKRRRFTDLHRAALRWPQSRFNYIGIDAEGEATVLAQEGEV